MTGSSVCVAIGAVALSFGGCLGDRAADRTLRIHQLQSTDRYTGQFQIDASQLPPNAITKRVDSGSDGAPITSLTINQKYPIRILLVPVGDDESATRDSK
jgi:hypothetical protein